MNKTIQIKALHAEIEDTKILKGVNLEIEKGKITVIMGPNGAGKSTLASVLMGHPSYEVTGGEVIMNDKNILELEVDERAREGLFLCMQNPVEIPGVSLTDFSHEIMKAQREDVNLFKTISMMDDSMDFLKMDAKFKERSINENFSGGEKKKTEIYQMLMLEPEFAIIDEVDSGLDVDALKVVSNGINRLRDVNGSGILIITHYNTILKYIKPDKVVILKDGVVATTGGPELVDKIEENGYEWIK